MFTKQDNITALIDADIIRYTLGFACQNTYHSLYRGDKLINRFKGKKALNQYMKENVCDGMDVRTETVPEPIEICLHSVKEFIKKIMKETGCTRYTCYLSESPNSRLAKYPDYKGNRVNNDKPLHYHNIGDYLRNNYPCNISTGDEADDAMGDEQYRQGRHTCICSTDKDMNTIPGWHYNPNKKVLYWVTPEDARLWFWCQMIIGDTADNIKGLPKGGTKKAYNLFVDKDPEKYPEIVYNAYLEYYDTPVEAREAFSKNRYLLKIGNRRIYE